MQPDQGSGAATRVIFLLINKSTGIITIEKWQRNHNYREHRNYNYREMAGEGSSKCNGLWRSKITSVQSCMDAILPKSNWIFEYSGLGSWEKKNVTGNLYLKIWRSLKILLQISMWHTLLHRHVWDGRLTCGRPSKSRLLRKNIHLMTRNFVGSLDYDYRIACTKRRNLCDNKMWKWPNLSADV